MFLVQNYTVSFYGSRELMVNGLYILYLFDDKR